MKGKQDEFIQYIEDQVSDLGIRAQRMFGGYGLYFEDTFFGIVHKGCLYLKTDASSREKYIAYGMQAFKPSQKQVLKNYYQVPADILESKHELKEWILESLGPRKAE